MKAVVHQPDFLPWEGFWHKAYAADVLVLWTGVQFTRRDYQHRVTMDGQWLTLPIQKAPQTTLIRDMLLDRDRYRGFLHDLEKRICGAPGLLNRRLDELITTMERPLHCRENALLLTDVTVPLIRMLARWLGLDTEIVVHSADPVGSTPEERLTNVLAPYAPGDYLVGTGAYNYLGSLGPDWKVRAPTFGHDVPPDSILIPALQGRDFQDSFSATVWTDYAA